MGGEQMIKDDIIRMAKEAGVSIRGHYDETGSTPQELERFAALVRADEREECAKVCEAREEQWRKAGFSKDVHEFREMAFAIRARGNT
jgi:hypothetical protein